MAHPAALFSLAPLTPRAIAVVQHPDNKHMSRLLNGKLVLDVGHVRSKSGDVNTIVEIGRNGDILVNASNISKVQCSFGMDPSTGIIMFYDHSSSHSSQVYCCSHEGSDEKVIPFEANPPRRVVVMQGINTIIGMGGVNKDLFVFQLLWPDKSDYLQSMEKVKSRGALALQVNQVNPRFARTTEYYADTDAPTQRYTRVHTTGHQQLKMRWKSIDTLGSGQFGDVHRGIDMDSGRVMAVKTLRKPSSWSGERWKHHLLDKPKREVENLSRLTHVSTCSLLCFHH